VFGFGKVRNLQGMENAREDKQARINKELNLQNWNLQGMEFASKGYI